MDSIFTNICGVVVAIIGLLLVCFLPTFQGASKIYGIILCCGYALYGSLRAIYLHLLDSHEGREFLKKIPIKRIQKRASEYKPPKYFTDEK